MVRVHPRWLAVRDLLRQKKIGDLRAFVGPSATGSARATTFVTTRRWAPVVLLDTGFYPVTMSRFCFDAEPVAVMARAESDPDRGADRLTSAILEFPQGTRSSPSAWRPSRCSEPSYRQGGHMELVNPGIRLAIHRRNRGQPRPSLEQPTPEPLSFDPVDQYTSWPRISRVPRGAVALASSARRLDKEYGCLGCASTIAASGRCESTQPA